jgi:hypothetical protein
MTALAVASVAASTAGAYTQSKAQKQQAKYQAAVARNNAIVAERAATDARERGEKEELNFRKQLSQLKGKQRAAFSGSGVVVDEDSPLDVLAETAELGEIDALTIRNNAEREAYGFENQARNFENSAVASDATASNINPFFTAGTTLLTSGTAAAFNLGFGSTPTPAPTAG